MTGVRALDATRLQADLCHNQPGVPCNDRFAATSIAVEPDRLTLGFPSLLALGLVSDGKPKELTGFHIQLAHPQGPTETKDAENPVTLLQAQPQGYTETRGTGHSVTLSKLRYTAGAPAMPKAARLTSDIAAGQIVAIAGEGKLMVGVELDPGQPPRVAYIRISGAEIESASGGEIDALGIVKLVASNRVVLSLRNAAPGSKVTVSVGLFDQGKPAAPQNTKVLDVVEGQRRPAGST